MPAGVFAGNGGTIGFNANKAYTPEEMQIFGWREGSSVDGVDGFPYIFRIATADVNEATSGITGGVKNGQGYWFKGTSMGTGSIADYNAKYPAPTPDYYDPASALDPAP